MAETCNDKHCPNHGEINPRGLILRGIVVRDKMRKGAVVRRELIKYVPKYNRYMKSHSRISVHNAECINAKQGDEVIIEECRPLSKTINFVITKVIKK